MLINMYGWEPVVTNIPKKDHRCKRAVYVCRGKNKWEMYMGSRHKGGVRISEKC